MSIRDVTNIAGFNAQEYQAVVDQAKKCNIHSSSVDMALLSAVSNGKSFSEAVSSVSVSQPSLTPPDSAGSMSSLRNWEALPAPGSMVMALLVKMAAQTRQTNRQLEWAQTEAVVNSMKSEAQKMRSTAATQLAMGIISSAVTVAGGAVQIKAASNNSMMAHGIGQAFEGAAKTFDSTGQYVGTMNQADLKEMEADQEKMRALRDSLKNLDDGMGDLIHKALSSMENIQQSKNQAMTKILA